MSNDGTELRGRSGGNVLKVGDKVRVEVESVDRFKRQIDFHMPDAAAKPKRKKARTLTCCARTKSPLLAGFLPFGNTDGGGNARRQKCLPASILD